jgi:hypothetical protein
MPIWPFQSLTFACGRDYDFSAAGIPAVGFGSPEQRRTTALSGFLLSVSPVNLLWVAQVGSRKARRSFARSSNLPVAAHPHLEVRARLNRLQRSFTMKRTPKGASAPKFLVISEAPYFTTYTGTRDQLISFGVALPEHFPEGRKRVKYLPHSNTYGTFGIKKIKGGQFKLTKWHPYKAPAQCSLALNHFGIVNNQNGGYKLHLFTAPDFRPDDELEQEINDAALDIVEMVSKARDRAKRNRLTLIDRHQRKDISEGKTA